MQESKPSYSTRPIFFSLDTTQSPSTQSDFEAVEKTEKIGAKAAIFGQKVEKKLTKTDKKGQRVDKLGVRKNTYKTAFPAQKPGNSRFPLFSQPRLLRQALANPPKPTILPSIENPMERIRR